MPSVDTLFAEVLTGPDYLDLTRRGRGVKPSDLIALGWRLFLRDWPYASEGPRKPKSALPAHRVDAAVALVERLAPELVVGAQLAHRVNRRVVELANAAGVSVTLADLSEPSLGRVAGLMCSGELPVGDDLTAWIDTAADEILRLRTKEPKHSGAQFTALYAGTVDRDWEAEGRYSLATAPPSHVALGADVRPLLAPAQGSTEDWTVGTDRTFYGRYQLHWKGVSGSDILGAPADDHWDTPRVARGGECDLAEIEIRRACRPLGLNHREHRTVIRAAHQGVAPTEGKHRGAWEAFRKHCRRAFADIELTAVVSDLTDSWLSGAAATNLKRHYGDLGNHVDLLQRGMARKAWIELLRREREFESPICSCGIGRTIRLGLTPGIPQAFHTFAIKPVTGAEDPLHFVSSPAEQAGDGFADPVERDEWHRQQATCAVLNDDVKVATMIFEQQPGWEESYQHIVAAEARAGGGVVELLSVDELRDYVLRLHRGREGRDQ